MAASIPPGGVDGSVNAHRELAAHAHNRMGRQRPGVDIALAWRPRRLPHRRDGEHILSEAGLAPSLAQMGDLQPGLQPPDGADLFGVQGDLRGG